MKKHFQIIPPIQTDTVVLHSCCAPCSSAIVEALLNAKISPIIFYYNPNIYPLEEYNKRKDECKRFAQLNNIPQFDADYNHHEWLEHIKGHESDCERGERCLLCFKMRMLKTAQFASAHNIPLFTTTLASSRWKDLEQINQAGIFAQQQTSVIFWAQNWRKGGLQQRRNELLKEYAFYNQLYCGCEFSKAQQQDKIQ